MTRIRALSWALAAAYFCAQAATNPVCASEQTRVQVVEGVVVSLPSPWRLSSRTKNAVELAYPRSPDRSVVATAPGQKPTAAEEMVTAEARMVILVEARRDHEDALARLAQIGSDRSGKAQWAVISGWPAVVSEYRTRLPAPGETSSQGDDGNITLHLGVAVAVESMVVRSETVLAPGAYPELLEQARQIATQIEVKKGDPKTSEREVRRLSALTHK